MGSPLERSSEQTLLLQSILTFYDRFARENSKNPQLQGEAAWAYRKVGALYESLGKHKEGEEAHARAIAMFEELVDQFPAERDYRYRLVETYILVDPWLAPESALASIEQQLQRAKVLAD
jgi:hypothetical protein